MIKKLIALTIILVLCALKTNAQVVEEIITDANGNVSQSKSPDEILVQKTAKEIADYFYEYQNDVDKIDPIISIYFYQKTPNYKLKEVLSEKYTLVGRYKSKKLVNTTTKDERTIKFSFEVVYEKKKALEEIILVKTSKNNPFQIFEYNVKIL